MSSDDMQDFASCPICYELMLDARMMSCGHTFCLQCLTGIYAADEQQILCPTCRSVSHKRPHELQKNFLACQMAEKISEKSAETPNQRADETMVQQMCQSLESHEFHDRCGSRLRISEDRRRASRDPDTHRNGVAFSSRPLRHDETFEIRVDEMSNKWHGSVQFGVCSHNPDSVDIPADITDMSDGVVVMNGDVIYKEGEMIHCKADLNGLIVGDRVGVCVSADGSLRFFINGRDIGVVVKDVRDPQWAVVFLYGKVTQVSITSLQNRASVQQEVASSLSSDMSFHSHCGRNVQLTGDRLVAERDKNTYDHGIVLSRRPLRDGELFQVRLDDLETQWRGGIEIGVICFDPDNLELPSTFKEFDSIAVVFRRSFVSNGITGTRKQNYSEVSLDDLEVGSRLGISVSADGHLRFFINGRDQGVAASHLPQPLWTVVDLYGRATKVSVCHDSAETTQSQRPIRQTLIVQSRTSQSESESESSSQTGAPNAEENASVRGVIKRKQCTIN